jgi:hypothetical protein
VYTTQQFPYNFVYIYAKTVPGVLSPMTDEEIDKLFDATDEAFEPLGYTRFEIAIAEQAPLFANMAELMKTLSSRDSARSSLRNLPEDDPTGLAQLLRILPMIVYKIREFLPDAIKELPHAPGGRPTAFTPEQRQQVCKEIGELLVKRVPLSAAYKRLGKRHGVSARTIQRIWNERERE